MDCIVHGVAKSQTLLSDLKKKKSYYKIMAKFPCSVEYILLLTYFILETYFIPKCIHDGSKSLV